MQKKFFAVATFALAFAVAFSASAYDLGSTTLKKGSKGAAVVELQKALNACNAAGISTDGSFGSGTQSAVKAFQSSKNLSADGKVGAMSKAALNSCTTSSSTSTSTSTSSNWSNSSAEGYLADISSDSSNRVSTVYESEADKVVAGVRATARLSDQKVERIKVTLKQTATTTASANLGKYISSVSVWNGSTKIATMSVADADRSNTDDTYTFNFTGLSGVIAKDQIGRFYVSVNANGSLDSNDATYASVTVKIEELRATSPNGVYTTSGSAGSPLVTQTGLAFGKFAANGVKAEIGLAASNPSSATITVNENSNTNNVTLLNFKVTAKNTNLSLRRIPVTVATTGSTLDSMVNSIKLMRGSTIVDQLDGSAHTAGVYSFNNLSSSANTISSGSSAEFSVVVDLKKQVGNFTAGSTLTASFSDLSTSAFSVQDSNGDQLPTGSSYRSGSAIGSAMTLRVKGVTSSMSSAATSAVAYIGQTASKEVTFNFPLNLIGSGLDYYVPKTALYVSSTTMPSATASKGIYFTVTDGAGTALSDASVVSSDVTSSATQYGSSTPKALLATSTGVNASLVVNVKRGVNSTAGFYKLIVLGYAGSETTDLSAVTGFAVDNQSAYTVTSNGTIQ